MLVLPFSALLFCLLKGSKAAYKCTVTVEKNVYFVSSIVNTCVGTCAIRITISIERCVPFESVSVGVGNAEYTMKLSDVNHKESNDGNKIIGYLLLDEPFCLAMNVTKQQNVNLQYPASNKEGGGVDSQCRSWTCSTKVTLRPRIPPLIVDLTARTEFSGTTYVLRNDTRLDICCGECESDAYQQYSTALVGELMVDAKTKDVNSATYNELMVLTYAVTVANMDGIRVEKTIPKTYGMNPNSPLVTVTRDQICSATYPNDYSSETTLAVQGAYQIAVRLVAMIGDEKTVSSRALWLHSMHVTHIVPPKCIQEATITAAIWITAVALVAVGYAILFCYMRHKWSTPDGDGKSMHPIASRRSMVSTRGGYGKSVRLVASHRSVVSTRGGYGKSVHTIGSRRSVVTTRGGCSKPALPTSSHRRLADRSSKKFERDLTKTKGYNYI